MCECVRCAGARHRGSGLLAQRMDRMMFATRDGVVSAAACAENHGTDSTAPADGMGWAAPCRRKALAAGPSLPHVAPLAGGAGRQTSV